MSTRLTMGACQHPTLTDEGEGHEGPCQRLALHVGLVNAGRPAVNCASG